MMQEEGERERENQKNGTNWYSSWSIEKVVCGLTFVKVKVKRKPIFTSHSTTTKYYFEIIILKKILPQILMLNSFLFIINCDFTFLFCPAIGADICVLIFLPFFSSLSPFPFYFLLCAWMWCHVITGVLPLLVITTCETDCVLVLVFLVRNTHPLLRMR